jgi:hypothetical protein
MGMLDWSHHHHHHHLWIPQNLIQKVRMTGMTRMWICIHPAQSNQLTIARSTH